MFYKPCKTTANLPNSFCCTVCHESLYLTHSLSHSMSPRYLSTQSSWRINPSHSQPNYSPNYSLSKVFPCIIFFFYHQVSVLTANITGPVLTANIAGPVLTPPQQDKRQRLPVQVKSRPGSALERPTQIFPYIEI